jgi:hypothetical protein
MSFSSLSYLDSQYFLLFLASVPYMITGKVDIHLSESTICHSSTIGIAPLIVLRFLQLVVLRQHFKGVCVLVYVLQPVVLEKA